MPGNNFSQFLSKKAYEISYALFRMAAVARRQSFADAMESRGLSFLCATTSGDYKNAMLIAASIDYILKFGADIGALSRTNAEIVTKEIMAFNAAIAELESSADFMPTAELSDVFSKLPLPLAKNGNNHVISDGGGKNGTRQEAASSEGIAIREERCGNSNSNGNGQGIVKTVPHSLIRQQIPAMITNNINGCKTNNGSSSHNGKSGGRQSAILERVRQNGNCRFKELQELLPDMSERTLRYDVQNLIEQGLIERAGNGGPATYYKTKNISPTA